MGSKAPAWWTGFFDAAMGRLLFDAKAERAAPREVAGLLRLTGLKAGAVLDTACGTGRHSLALAGRGFQVCGVDTSAAYLREARRRARAAGLKIAFRRTELRDLRPERGRFDLVLNLFSSFGYYPTAAANVAALRQLAACLRPGGWLALELMPAESLRRHVIPLDSSPVPGGRLLEARRWLRHGRVLETRVLWQQGRRGRERVSRMQVYTRAELAALMRRCGLGSIQSFGSYQGAAFKVGGSLLVLGKSMSQKMRGLAGF